MRNKGIDWDAQPLGDVPDAAIARALGVSRCVVGKARRRRNISACVDRPSVDALGAASCSEFVEAFTQKLWTAERAADVFGGAPSTMHDAAAAKVDSSIPHRLAFDVAGVARLEELYCVRFDVASDDDDRAIDVGGVRFIRTSSVRVDDAEGQWMTRDDAAEAMGVTRGTIEAMHRRGDLVRRGRGRGQSSSVMYFVPDSKRTSATPTDANSVDSRINEIHDMVTRLCASLGV